MSNQAPRPKGTQRVPQTEYKSRERGRRVLSERGADPVAWSRAEGPRQLVDGPRVRVSDDGHQGSYGGRYSIVAGGAFQHHMPTFHSRDDASSYARHVNALRGHSVRGELDPNIMANPPTAMLHHASDEGMVVQPVKVPGRTTPNFHDRRW